MESDIDLRDKKVEVAQTKVKPRKRVGVVGNRKCHGGERVEMYHFCSSRNVNIRRTR